jgi:putative spermidine/putrescine transport system ATP-binding protein
MSDRVILMHRGRTEQSAVPSELFWRPRTRFAAQFMGEANILSGSPLDRIDDVLRIDLGGGLICAVADPEHSAASEFNTVEFALRGERIMLGPAATGCRNRYEARIVDLRFYGSLSEINLTLVNGMRIRARLKAGDSERSFAIGDEIDVGWNAADAVLLAG